MTEPLCNSIVISLRVCQHCTALLGGGFCYFCYWLLDRHLPWNNFTLLCCMLRLCWVWTDNIRLPVLLVIHTAVNAHRSSYTTDWKLHWFCCCQPSSLSSFLLLQIWQEFEWMRMTELFTSTCTHLLNVEIKTSRAEPSCVCINNFNPRRGI